MNIIYVVLLSFFLNRDRRHLQIWISIWNQFVWCLWEQWWVSAQIINFFLFFKIVLFYISFWISKWNIVFIIISRRFIVLLIICLPWKSVIPISHFYLRWFMNILLILLLYIQESLLVFFISVSHSILFFNFFRIFMS